MRIVGVVPAAGHGTRLREGPGAWQASKEIMPVRGRPVVEHLLDRLFAVPGITVRLVTRSDKADLRDHLADRDVTVVLGEPADVSASVALGVQGLAPDDLVLVGFPDTVWGPADGFPRLVDGLRDPGVDVALGLFRLPDVRAADEVETDGADRVVRVTPKPSAPTSSWTWGCVAVRRHVLDALGGHQEPGRLWDELARTRPGGVLGVRLGSDFVDVGTPAGRARAESGD